MKSEGEIITYQDLLSVPAGENNEALVDVLTLVPSIIAQYQKLEMAPYTGGRIFVRESLARKLQAVEAKVNALYGFHLKIVYGYRHPDVQEKYFTERRKKMVEEYPGRSPEEIDEITHGFIAVPSVAGHPTGGAIDISLIQKDGSDIDMGTGIADFRYPEKIKTFAKDLSPEQIENRRMLHDALINEGFAPFYGEWWHFSYGDKEWAYFYEKPASRYSPINFKI